MCETEQFWHLTTCKPKKSPILTWIVWNKTFRQNWIAWNRNVFDNSSVSLCYTELFEIELFIYIKMDLVLNNLQKCWYTIKPKQTNKQTSKHWEEIPFCFITEVHEEKAWQGLEKYTTCCVETIVKTALNKTSAVRPIRFHLTNYGNKMNKTCRTQQEK